MGFLRLPTLAASYGKYRCWMEQKMTYRKKIIRCVPGDIATSFILIVLSVS